MIILNNKIEPTWPITVINNDSITSKINKILRTGFLFPVKKINGENKLYVSNWQIDKVIVNRWWTGKQMNADRR